MIIRETDYYTLETRNKADSGNGYYAIVNKQTGIEEFETRILPEGFMVLKQFTDLMENEEEPVEEIRFDS